MRDANMSIVGHLRELRKRILIAGVFYLSASSASFFYVNRLSALLRTLGGGLSLVYISPSEALVTDVRLSFWVGFYLSLPVIAYQLWAFTCPALHRRERLPVFGLMCFSIVLFLAGSMFVYAAVLPVTMAFFTSFAAPGLSPLISYDRYVTFVSTLTLMFGLVFQTPLVILFLTSAGFVTPQALRRQRKMVVFVVFVVAAVLTPPDVVSQFLMAVKELKKHEQQ